MATAARRTLGPAPKGTGSECKAVAGFKAREWREEPPLHYQIQLQAQLACTGAQWGSLVALIGGVALAWRDLLRNDDFIEAALPKLEEFWWRVQHKQPPEADALPGTTEAIRRLWPGASGATVALDAEAGELMADVEAARAMQRGFREGRAARAEQARASGWAGRRLAHCWMARSCADSLVKRRPTRSRRPATSPCAMAAEDAAEEMRHGDSDRNPNAGKRRLPPRRLRRGTVTRNDFAGQQLTQVAETAVIGLAAQARAIVEARFIVAIQRPRDWTTSECG